MAALFSLQTRDITFRWGSALSALPGVQTAVSRMFWASEPCSSCLRPSPLQFQKGFFPYLKCS